MSSLAKPLPSSAQEVSTGALLDALAAHERKPLIFTYDSRDVLPVYHVTEIKAGRFEALDCGANLEEWCETFIQLWDVRPEPGQVFMQVGKFLAIMRKAAEHVPFDPTAKLTFEVSDGASALQLLRASSIDTDGHAVRVSLTHRPASCKPRDRWLEQQTSSGCCSQAGKQEAKAACCN